MRLVLVWVSRSADLLPSSTTIDTLPLGLITSFTKNAASDTIGPQPASYQPTEPSSNSIWKCP
jgi:hypothetical protein